MTDKKITQLTEATTIALTDVVPIVSDPSGTPVNKKVTVANLGLGAFIGFAAQSTVAQGIPTGTDTGLTFSEDEEILDTNGWHSNTNPEKITVDADGVYAMWGGGEFISNPSGTSRYIYFRLFHSTDAPMEIGDSFAATTSYGNSVFTVRRLVSGDSIELSAYHQTGGNLNIVRKTIMIQRIQ
jgi:hypothetical protein